MDGELTGEPEQTEHHQLPTGAWFGVLGHRRDAHCWCRPDVEVDASVPAAGALVRHRTLRELRTG